MQLASVATINLDPKHGASNTSFIRVASTQPRPQGSILDTIIGEARRRARKRRWRYAIALLLLIAAVAVALASVRDRSAPGPPPHAPVPSTPQPLALERQPYLGVSCHAPNDISCDRVGLAVWLHRPASRLSATIGTRRIALRIPCGSASRYAESCHSYCRRVSRQQPCGTYFEGFLRPAGLLSGPARVRHRRDRSKWTGTPPSSRVVRIVAQDHHGKTATVRLRVPLAAGWG